MKQSVLDRAVARATGESLSVIRRMGFSIVNAPSNTRSYWPGRNRKPNRRKLATASSES